MDQVPQLKVSDLYTRRITKDAARLRAYNQILDSIYSRIRNQSQLPNSPANLLFTIPPFILGLPRIDLEDCVIYHERSYILEQSPIMQAMLVTSNSLKDKQHSKIQRNFEKKPKKEKAEKAGKPANVVISPYALDNNRSVGQTPQASDYQPPSVFLKQMEGVTEKRQINSSSSVPASSGVLADLWKLS